MQRSAKKYSQQPVRLSGLPSFFLKASDYRIGDTINVAFSVVDVASVKGDRCAGGQRFRIFGPPKRRAFAGWAVLGQGSDAFVLNSSPCLVINVPPQLSVRSHLRRLPLQTRQPNRRRCSSAANNRNEKQECSNLHRVATL